MAPKKKPEPEVEIEIVLLTDLDLGRIAHQLRNDYHETRTGRYWENTRQRTKRRYTNGQIAKLLDVTVERLIELDHLYTISRDRWGDGRLQERILLFVKKEKRWPQRDDFGSKNDMPSPGVYANMGDQGILRSWLNVEKNVRSLHPNVILGVQNVTWRAELIERYGGYQEIIQKGGGTQRQQDDYGILWELPPEPDVDEDVALWLEVTNATVVEGEQEHFFLRMPPEIRTAKAAVEWSFKIPRGQLEEFAAQT